jgi:hypothetical protein
VGGREGGREYHILSGRTENFSSFDGFQAIPARPSVEVRLREGKALGSEKVKHYEADFVMSRGITVFDRNSF